MDQLDHIADEALTLEGEPSQSLIDTARWTKFIGIIFIIFAVLITLSIIVSMASDAVVFRGALLAIDRSSARMLIVVMLIFFLAVIILTAAFLLNFSGKIKLGLDTNNPEITNKGLAAMKNYLILTGILAILYLLLNLFALTQ